MKEDLFADLNNITDKVLAYKRKPDANASAPTAAPGLAFYEFFAGGGMARAGLGARWTCLFANDFDFKKAAAYKENWGDATLHTKDVRKVEVSELPGKPGLVWASFPCQDLSLAGMGAGLKGDRSGTFWPFWELVKKLVAKRRAPRMIVLENVCGMLTSHGGKDFTAIADALSEAGYRFGALVADAIDFVPQSRPRLFIIAVAKGVNVPAELLGVDGSMHWHPKALQLAQLRLTGKAKENWLWWKLPAPPRRNTRFADLVEDNPTSVTWHTIAETEKLLDMMSEGNLYKVVAAKRSNQRLVGAVYKRTRLEDEGKKVQRAEIRFDDVAGCLRTSSGGSSRQLIMVIKGSEVRSRLLSSREAARLMGLPDEYKLPKSYNEAYHLMGDGLVVPVVRFLAENLLEPILLSNLMEADLTDVSSHPLSAKH
ncbi:MAG: DNA cytosine methyltransferase [Proteobacteria bacterium]|nr:DNA cytosine methyltransferase [Pseudomonadota bacterium]